MLASYQEWLGKMQKVGLPIMDIALHSGTTKSMSWIIILTKPMATSISKLSITIPMYTA